MGPPVLAPELFVDFGSLKTSVVYLLPHISAAKYTAACACIRAMGVENFALTLQALARNATDNGALARGRRRASKRASLSQPSSITLDPVPEQVPSVDASQDLSADLTPASMDEPMHRAVEASGMSSGTPTSGVAAGSSDLQEPFPGHVQPGEISDGCDDKSVSAETVAGARPADLSNVPTDLVPKDQGKRHQGTLDGHPVGEASETSAVWILSDDSSPKEIALAPDWSPAGYGICTSLSHCRTHLCQHCGASPAIGVGEGVKPSGSSNQRLLQRNDSSIVLKGESSGSIDNDGAKEVVTCLAWDDPSQPPAAQSLRKDAPRFATANTPGGAPSVVSRQSDNLVVNGSESPVGVLREALQKYEDGSEDVTVEGLARLQLRAQEYATRASPVPGSRMKRRRRLAAAVGRPVGKACDANKGSSTAPGRGAETGPVAASIVDDTRLSSTAHQLRQESSLKKSLRQCEAQRIVVCAFRLRETVLT